MKRTTITLTDELAGIVEREAQRRATSVSELVRQAMLAYFELTGDQPRRLPFAALGNSGHRHTARDLEEILDEEWGRAGDR
jgi:metal-responsive CopG/Arc/MetJ family transcriptional regulator